MRVINRIAALLICSVVLLQSCNLQPKEALDYVNPLIGTDGIGHTFPGATTPFGMVQLSPSDDTEGWNWCSGYHYSDKTLKGFAHNHFSGTGLAGMGDILLMPVVGEVNTKPGTKEDPASGYRSKFSHENETASPGYYSVVLDDNHVEVELTASPRVGFHRYTFSKAGKQNVIIDATHGVRQQVLNASVEIVSDTEVKGHKYCHDQSCGKRKVFFYAKFSKPFKTSGVTVEDEIVSDANMAEDKTAKAFVQFDGDDGDVVEVAVAISYVDHEGAKANYVAEGKGKSFDEVHTAAREMWKEKVTKIEIEGTDEQKTVFYTGMYHNFIAPNIISDVNGNYVVEGKKYNSKGRVQYSNFSTWDTYRATHPLWSIIDQKTNKEMVNVLVSRFTDTKTGLALWEALGFDNYCMPGYPGIAAMAEAALKHPEGLDKELIYKCIRETAFRDGGCSVNYGSDNGVRYYVNYSFIPAEVGCGISKTTENNYYDFAIAQLAKNLGKKEDEELFKKRSLGYRNLFNPEVNYLWPRLSSGNWIEMDTTGWDELVHHYVSGNIWAYSAYTPHDMLGAVDLFGGKEKYSDWLDNMIGTPLNMKGEQHVDIAGFIGKYSHGDEPGHQIPYLYNFAGKPWKTQELARRVMTEMYSHKLDGMVNNEDCGQMSAWYIFSAMGFYPVAPADLNYYFGSPLLPKAVINLEDGKKFTVIAKGTSAENKYIQSVSLNGEKVDKLYITHNDIMQGGELVFEMGSTPNKDWGVGENALPQYQKDLAKYKAVPQACFTPYITDPKLRFSDKRTIKLVTKTEGAKVYYTLDGSTPTEKSKEYTKPFEVKKMVELKAIAYKDGLKPSQVYTQKLQKSVFVVLDEGYPKITFENVPQKYGAKDGSQLVDMIYGSETFSDRKWTGVNRKNLVIEFDLGKPMNISSVELNTLTSTLKWRFPPKSITILAKNAKGKYNLVTRKSFDKINGHAKKINHHMMKFSTRKTQYVKVIVENYGALPKWHRGAGKLPWIFVDEVNIN